MAVAVWSFLCVLNADCAHPNNTLILGPGGFKFGDYWQMGLPLQLIVFGGQYSGITLFLAVVGKWQY